MQRLPVLRAASLSRQCWARRKKSLDRFEIPADRSGTDAVTSDVGILMQNARGVLPP
jgi:hypothetical protein